MHLERQGEFPLSGAKWAAKSEAYATLISEHLCPHTVWLDAGCGSRLLEDHMEALEDRLVHHCGLVVGMDLSVGTHRNIGSLVRESIYTLPFADSSLDLVTCNMVVDISTIPLKRFPRSPVACRPNGAFVVNTPNLLNYGVMGNAVASRVLREKWRLRLVHGSDARKPADFFPVRYKANTLAALPGCSMHPACRFTRRLLCPSNGLLCGRKKLERLLMKLTPFSGLLVCAHKRSTTAPE